MNETTANWEAQMKMELEGIIHVNKIFGKSDIREHLLSWRSRWAGRPSREEIYDAIFDYCTNWKKSGKGIITLAEGLVPILRILYPAPTSEQKRVSREEIEAFFSGTYGSWRTIWRETWEGNRSKRTVLPQFLNDLCTLLNGVEEEKPVKRWCYCYHQMLPGVIIPVVSVYPPICAECKLEIPRPVEKGRE